MIKRTILSALLVLLTLSMVSAQTSAQAEKILNDLLNTAKTSAIRTNFKLSISENKSTPSQFTTGTFTLKGSKFVLDVPQMKVWFDGKTQWAFSVKNNEVTVTEPTEKELAETNPMAIIAGFKTKSMIHFSKSKSAQNHVIELLPKVKHKDISRLEVEINKSTGNLVSIRLINNTGGVTALFLSNFEKGIKVTDNFFVFNESKFKGVSTNDLR